MTLPWCTRHKITV